MKSFRRWIDEELFGLKPTRWKAITPSALAAGAIVQFHGDFSPDWSLKSISYNGVVRARFSHSSSVVLTTVFCPNGPILYDQTRNAIHRLTYYR